jgi:GH15 family glucan-1,4-alpha-glucosidase
MVLELGVIHTSKSRALDLLRSRHKASAVLFLGDDDTDEEAFASLKPGDLGIKVGPGATVAEHRIASTAEAAALLQQLVELRAVAIGPITDIDSHALLSDQRTIALISPGGRIVWLCLPRIDSSAVMSELLGGDTAGYFEIAPDSPAEPTQSYEPDSFILRTHWNSGGGPIDLIDYLDCSGGRPYQRPGRTDLIRVVEGSGTVRLIFAPRFDFGRAATRLTPFPDGLEVEGAADPLVLYAPGIAWRITETGRHQTAEATIQLTPGSPLLLELRSGTRNLKPAILPEPERRAQTHRFWKNWAGSLSIPPLQPDLVRRSALAIKSLVHGPSGAIAAAATTSLPEVLAGTRNWDYRFCWPRDAALAATALVRLGNTGHAMRLLDWLLSVVDSCESPDRLRPIYTVSGAELGAEAEIGELSGYAASRPVRVGNAAAQQVQLDVFGPITDLIALLAARGAPLTPEHWRLTQAMAAAVQSRWEEPDHGIWEVRGPRLHHTYTKVMCWQTMDRAITIADQHQGRIPPGWTELRARIAADVLSRGYSETARAFTTAYDCEDLDAAALHVGLSGLLNADDPRFVSTVDRIAEGLLEGPTVYRYRFDDGLPGREGGFHICTGWLIEALCMLGRPDEALALFNSLCATAGPLGLFAEQHDSVASRALGNFPQAYSHLAVINAAIRLTELTSKAGPPAAPASVPSHQQA